MAELGTYYITIMPDMSQFTGKVKTALGTAGNTGGKSFGGKFSDVLKGSAIGTALGGLAQRAGRSIADGVGVGIKRLDTLKNYPKVMESLGYSTDDADRSIKTIMDHLDGLPSSTQDLVTLTQAISDSTGDLDLATAAALGFNDMMLANGASAAEVATAQGVLNRVLGKGSATAAQWQSLTSVMPAQLGMVARSMLGAGATTEDLHSALEDGTVSWNDFLKAIAELDQSGYIDENGRKLASFEQQARANSNGIGTAIENVKNRIGAGWASIFDAVGQEAVSGTIDKMSYGVKSAMTRVADGIAYLKDKIGQTKIGENLGKIGKAVGDALKGFAATGAEKLKPIADAMVDLIDKGLQWVVDHGDLVASVLAGIGTALAFKGAVGAVTTITGVAGGLKTLGSTLSLVSGVGDLSTAFTLAAETGGPLSGMFSGLGGIIGFVAANPMVAIGAAIAAVVGGLVFFFTQTEKGKEIWGNFCDGLKDFGASVAKDVKGGLDKIKQNLEDNKVQWQQFKTNLGKWSEETRQNVLKKWTAIKDGMSKTWANIKGATSAKVSEVKSAISTGWDNVKTNTTTKWNAVKSAVSTAWTNIKSVTSAKATEIKNAASTAWDNMKSTASSKFDSIKSTISSKMGDAKSALSGKLGEMKSAITGFAPKFKTISAPVIGSITSALQSLRDKITSFKPSFPKLSWPKPSMPHIPVPHFSVTSTSILGGLVKVPKVSFRGWWAKGGVFDSPSIIGIGEAGKEAALPLNKHVYGEIARGISREGAGGVTVHVDKLIVREEADINRIADALGRKIKRERWAMT